MNTILTDDEISKISSTPCAVVGSYVHTFARAIEAAVLAKLREQEPVAWRAKDANDRWMYGDTPAPDLPGSQPELLALAAPLPAVVQVPQDEGADGPLLDGDDWVITMANGHSGPGWYAHCEDYPEEGAVFVAAAPEAPAQADHTKLLRMIAQRAKCFPSYPLGYHIPEVFAAIGEKPPQPESPARPSACRLTECEGRAMCPTCTVLAAPEAPAQTYICTETMHTEIPCPKCKPLPALHAEVREALKVAREALAGFIAITSDSRGVSGYHLSGDTAEWDEFDEVDAAVAALARIDALGGGE